MEIGITKKSIVIGLILQKTILITRRILGT
jgi:hypothetical protein